MIYDLQDNIKKANNFCIIGFGESGQASVKLLRNIGIKSITVVDHSNIDTSGWEDVTFFVGDEAIKFEHYLSKKSSQHIRYDYCIVSPGVPLNSNIVRIFGEAGIPVISEVDLGLSFISGRVLAVTGSSGKSTVCKFCFDTFNIAGFNAIVCGNYGIPVSEVALSGKQYEWIVLEISSFQLESSRYIKPNIAILLNIYNNHLDRHKDFNTYKTIKMSIFNNQRENDIALMPSKEKDSIPLNYGKPCWLFFGNHEDVDGYYNDEQIIINLKYPHNVKASFNVSGSYFDKAGYRENLTAAILALISAGVDERHIYTGIHSFKPLPHRMQEIGEYRGVKFINDSKSTTTYSLAVALQNMRDKSVFLIAGGRLKEKDVKWLVDILRKKVKKAFLIGECAEILFREWNEFVKCEICSSLEESFNRAVMEADKGEVILLSPAATSFDQFKSYEERGDVFIKLFKRLTVEA